MLEDSEVFCFSCKTNPLYTRCTGLNCCDVNCWTPHSACRSTFSGGTCRGTLLHCLIGSNYCLTSSTQWCTVGLDPKMELLNKLHNIHLCECSFAIKCQISFRFLLISNACNKLSTNLFLFHYHVLRSSVPWGLGGLPRSRQGDALHSDSRCQQRHFESARVKISWDTRCSCLAVCSPKPPRVQALFTVFEYNQSIFYAMKTSKHVKTMLPPEKWNDEIYFAAPRDCQIRL